jgi:hypothetical protein
MKAMSLPEEMKNLVDDLVYSYESRIQNIESLFDSTYITLQGFQEFYSACYREREDLSTQLRESLAKTSSFRKKDFDKMMQDILSLQDESEKEVRSLFNSYLDQQKEMTHTLRHGLSHIKEALCQGDVDKVRYLQDRFREIFPLHEKRKEEVIDKLKSIQKEQQDIGKNINSLLAKGKELKIKDFKTMLTHLKKQHQERMTRQAERIEEVHHMLADFNKERMESAENWKSLQEKEKSERVDFVAQLNKNVDSMLKDFAYQRKKKSQAQEKALAEFSQELNREVNTMIKDFTSGRKEMSAKQEQALSDFVSDLSRQVDSMLKGFQYEREIGVPQHNYEQGENSKETDCWLTY